MIRGRHYFGNPSPSSSQTPSRRIYQTYTTRECLLLLRQFFKFPFPPPESMGSVTNVIEAADGVARINLQSPEETYFKFLGFLWKHDKGRLEDALRRLEDGQVLSIVGAHLGITIRNGGNNRNGGHLRDEAGKLEKRELQRILLVSFNEELVKEVAGWVQENSGPLDELETATVDTSEGRTKLPNALKASLSSSSSSPPSQSPSSPSSLSSFSSLSSLPPPSPSSLPSQASQPSPHPPPSPAAATKLAINSSTAASANKEANPDSPASSPMRRCEPSTNSRKLGSIHQIAPTTIPPASIAAKRKGRGWKKENVGSTSQKAGEGTNHLAHGFPQDLLQNSSNDAFTSSRSELRTPPYYTKRARAAVGIESANHKISHRELGVETTRFTSEAKAEGLTKPQLALRTIQLSSHVPPTARSQIRTHLLGENMPAREMGLSAKNKLDQSELFDGSNHKPSKKGLAISVPIFRSKQAIPPPVDVSPSPSTVSSSSPTLVDVWDEATPRNSTAATSLYNSFAENDRSYAKSSQLSLSSNGLPSGVESSVKQPEYEFLWKGLLDACKRHNSEFSDVEGDQCETAKATSEFPLNMPGGFGSINSLEPPEEECEEKEEAPTDVDEPHSRPSHIHLASDKGEEDSLSEFTDDDGGGVGLEEDDWAKADEVVVESSINSNMNCRLLVPSSVETDAREVNQRRQPSIAELGVEAPRNDLCEALSHILNPREIVYPPVRPPSPIVVMTMTETAAMQKVERENSDWNNTMPISNGSAILESPRPIQILPSITALLSNVLVSPRPESPISGALTNPSEHKPEHKPLMDEENAGTSSVAESLSAPASQGNATVEPPPTQEGELYYSDSSDLSLSDFGGESDPLMNEFWDSPPTQEQSSAIPTFSQFTQPLADKFYELPYWAQYEATRVALHCDVELSNDKIVSEFILFVDSLLDACLARDKQASWRDTLRRFAEHRKAKLPKYRVSPSLWASLQDLEQSENRWTDNLYLTGKVIPSAHKSLGPLRITLNPIQQSSSNRFYRRFGSHRFLTLKLPPLEKKYFKQLPKENPIGRFDNDENIKKSLVRWVFLIGFQLLGRQWKGIYVKESGKAQMGKGDHTTKRRDDRCFQAVFFAETGQGIRREDEMTVQQLLNWHVPLLENLGQTIPKLWSRISIGFSSSVKGITFTKDQICPGNKRTLEGRYQPDENVVVFGPDGEKQVMNDGCDTISLGAMVSLTVKFGLDEVPTAVQARIGAGKGLWLLDPRQLSSGSQSFDNEAKWIRVNESQYKYRQHNVPNPDLAWLTLDVLAFSKPPAPARMNNQIIPILKERGVPTENIEALLSEFLDRELQALFDALKNPVSLRKWLYSNGNIRTSRDRDRINDWKLEGEVVEFQGGVPMDQYEKLLMFIDAGFEYRSMPYFQRNLKLIMNKHWKQLKTKMHIEVEQSTILFCVADPTFTLEEGEVYLHFSQGLLDPSLSRARNLIEGDILVARNPALLPTDIQKVTAVNRPELQHLRDVIVFSQKGSRSLASLLSGGDYDGDRCWICWDKRLVEPFQKQNPDIKEPPGLQEKWFTRTTKTLKDLSVASLISTKAGINQLATQFLVEGAEAALSDTGKMLGIYTIAHGECAKERGLSHPSTIELAFVCSSLVDAKKQGMQLVQNHETILSSVYPHWRPKDRGRRILMEKPILERLQEFGAQKILAKEDEFRRMLDKDHRPVVHQGRGTDSKGKKLAGSAYCPDAEEGGAYDPDLIALAVYEDKEADKDSTRQLRKCLSQLSSAIRRIREQWAVDMQRYKVLKQDVENAGNEGTPFSRRCRQGTPFDLEEDDSESHYSLSVLKAYEDFQTLKPAENYEVAKSYSALGAKPSMQETPSSFTHPTILRWISQAERRDEYSEWSFLKASWVVKNHGAEDGFVWAVAGWQLCYIKAKAVAKSTGKRVRFVTEGIWASLKTDRRVLAVEDRGADKEFEG